MYYERFIYSYSIVPSAQITDFKIKSDLRECTKSIISFIHQLTQFIKV